MRVVLLLTALLAAAPAVALDLDVLTYRNLGRRAADERDAALATLAVTKMDQAKAQYEYDLERRLLQENAGSAFAVSTALLALSRVELALAREGMLSAGYDAEARAWARRADWLDQGILGTPAALATLFLEARQQAASYARAVAVQAHRIAPELAYMRRAEEQLYTQNATSREELVCYRQLDELAQAFAVDAEALVRSAEQRLAEATAETGRLVVE